jgi:hypothetical protein
VTDDVAIAVTYTLVFGLPSLLGLRATWRLWRIYLYDEDSRRQVILLAFAVIATVITTSGIVFGGLALRRFLGFEQLPFASALSLLLAALILLIPAGLEWLVSYVGRLDDSGRRRRSDD